MHNRARKRVALSFPRRSRLGKALKFLQLGEANAFWPPAILHFLVTMRSIVGTGNAAEGQSALSKINAFPIGAPCKGRDKRVFVWRESLHPIGFISRGTSQ